MKNGVITVYNPTNRFGYIKPSEGGEIVGFYLNVVQSSDQAPKAGDKVNFDAPEPRKNKKNKLVQGNASTVEIVERAASEAPPPSEIRKKLAKYEKNLAGVKKPGKKNFKKRSDRPVKEGEGEGKREGKRFKDKNSDGQKRKPRVRKTKDGVVIEVAGLNQDKSKFKKDLNKKKRNYKYPFSNDVAGSFNPMIANPSLFIDKLIEWPNTNQIGFKTSQEEAKRGLWNFSLKNEIYFLNKRFERCLNFSLAKYTPWTKIIERRDFELTQIKSMGYATNSIVLTVQKPLVNSEGSAGILTDLGFELNQNFGFPSVNSIFLKKLFESYVLSLKEKGSDMGLRLSKLLERDLSKGERLNFLDGIYLLQGQSVKVERFKSSGLPWEKVSSDKDVLCLTSDKEFKLRIDYVLSKEINSMAELSGANEEVKKSLVDLFQFLNSAENKFAFHL